MKQFPVFVLSLIVTPLLLVIMVELIGEMLA